MKQIKETRTNEFVKKKIDIISRKIEALSMEIQNGERERERISLFVWKASFNSGTNYNNLFIYLYKEPVINN